MRVIVGGLFSKHSCGCAIKAVEGFAVNEVEVAVVACNYLEEHTVEYLD